MTKSNLRRIMSLLLVAVLCFSLTACSSSSSEESEWSVWTEVSYIEGSDDTDATNSEDAATPSGSGSSSKKDTGKTSSKDAGNDKNPAGTVDKKDLKGYTFTLMSPYLPSKLTSNCTGFEKLLFHAVNKCM